MARMSSMEGLYQFVAGRLGCSLDAAKRVVYSRAYGASEGRLRLLQDEGEIPPTFYPLCMVIDGILIRYLNGERE